MKYIEHKKYFGVSYKTGTDAWSHMSTASQGVRLIEKLSPNAMVLDIGAGRGYFAKHLAELGFRVIGIDFEAEIVKKANKDIKDWKLEGKLRFMEADALDIPLEDRSFDAVCDFGLFETLFKDDWPKYANEVTRVLKPGGFYFNVSLSRETQQFYEFSPIKDKAGDFEKYGIHYHFFERNEMKNIFADKLELVSQEVKFSKKEKKVALLETLFKKSAGTVPLSNPKMVR